MEWSPRPPELNRIEHVWEVLDRVSECYVTVALENNTKSIGDGPHNFEPRSRVTTTTPVTTILPYHANWRMHQPFYTAGPQ
ncbi:hypothetical protein TNCV_1613771 [Trichonephila clavipes]|nr:hypothetical protein TNCV_1613771 [Trichonephila clavipes]